VWHCQKTRDSSNESDILARLGFYKQTTHRKYTLRWSRTRRSTDKLYYIIYYLSTSGLVIHVESMMLKAKASNSRPRSDSDKAKTKYLALMPTISIPAVGKGTEHDIDGWV